MAGGLNCRKGFEEVHHLDGNTLNNHPSNLQYVPSEIHALITKYQRRVVKYLKTFKEGKMLDFVIWNRKGKLVTRIEEFVAQILVRTLVKSAKRFPKFQVIVKQFAEWMFKIIKRLRLKVDITFVPCLIIEELV